MTLGILPELIFPCVISVSFFNPLKIVPLNLDLFKF